MEQKNFGIALPNDRAREDFLRDYTNEEHGWYLWVETPQVQRRWYRRDFDGWSIVIEEADHAVKARIANCTFPQTKMVIHMFLVDDWSLPLRSHISVKTEIMSRLRDITRNGGTV